MYKNRVYTESYRLKPCIENIRNVNIVVEHVDIVTKCCTAGVSFVSFDVLETRLSQITLVYKFHLTQTRLYGQTKTTDTTNVVF